MTPDEEMTTIKKVLDGDVDAFEELVLANQKNVYNLALKMTKNEEDALDISQEAFLKAFRQLDAFRGESRFSVWLYRLTYNLCIDFLRKKNKAQISSLSAYQDENGNPHDVEIPDMRELPEDRVFRKELRKEIAESIGKLSQSHREVLVMREINEMSYAEIAGTLSISEGTVKSRLARARLNLANILVEKGTFAESNRHNKRGEVEQHD
ncbi:MAG: sigma-70 family RNA polymerase sigma factor [Oscillospiraceae bacterium]|nr:sigma-70 family RNA polymerase sigma factor [Oscillospiraceae bacterium]